FTRWQTATTSTTASYSGASGHTYGFYSVATDKVGNVQSTPTTAQASTLVKVVSPPPPSPPPPPASSPNLVGVPLFAAGADAGGSPTVTVYNSDGTAKSQQSVFAPNFTG